MNGNVGDHCRCFIGETCVFRSTTPDRVLQDEQVIHRGTGIFSVKIGRGVTRRGHRGDAGDASPHKT